jgi:hypothetical protein
MQMGEHRSAEDPGGRTTMCAGAGPDGSAWIRNLRKPMPLGRKLRLVARNTWIKISRLQSCCGHHGEPGC